MYPTVGQKKYLLSHGRFLFSYLLSHGSRLLYPMVVILFTIPR